MRKKIVAGNWKMNKNAQEALALAQEINAQLADYQELAAHHEVVICPPFPFLERVQSAATHSQLKVGAQNCHQNESGAFTGEIAASMLKSLNLEYVIIGHSERRAYFGETNDLLKSKLDAALSAGLKVIFCFGEQLAQREDGTYFEVIKTQLNDSLFHLSESQMSAVVLAYEPVWAIGTGKTASPEQAEEIHAYTRQLLENQYNTQIANACTILYGGSCKPTNAAALFSQTNVDGGLIGGAALKADSFMGIIKELN